MAGRGWKSRLGPGGGADGTAPGVGTPGLSVPNAADLMSRDPRLQKLNAERQALETHMAALTGQPVGAGQDARRFPVEGVDARRRQHQAWEARREADRQNAQAALAGQGGDAFTRPDRLSDGAFNPRDAASVPRTALLDRMSMLPGARNGLRRGPGLRDLDARPTVPEDEDAPDFDARRASATAKLRSLRQAAEGVRAKARELSGKLDDADRRLAAEGASEEDRQGLREATAPIRGALERADKTLDGPVRYARKVEEALQRPKAKSNPIDEIVRSRAPEALLRDRTRERMTPRDPRETFRERAERLLRVDRDPDELDRRRGQMHERALQNRRAREREEAMDERRRERAQEKARARKREEGEDR